MSTTDKVWNSVRHSVGRSIRHSVSDSVWDFESDSIGYSVKTFIEDYEY